MECLRDQVQAVFQDVFGDDQIVLNDSMTAGDIEGWDSLMHINLVVAMEKRFGIKFATAEIAGMKAQGQNIGTLVQMLSGKIGATGSLPAGAGQSR